MAIGQDETSSTKRGAGGGSSDGLSDRTYFAILVALVVAGIFVVDYFVTDLFSLLVGLLWKAATSTVAVFATVVVLVVLMTLGFAALLLPVWVARRV